MTLIKGEKMNTIKEIANAIKGFDDILVLSHISPDGDTLGSATALIRALRSMGKRADFSCADEVGGIFSYLFEDLENIGFTPKHVISVDVAELSLLGENKDKYSLDICIDHHRTNKMVAKMSHVDETAATNTLIVFDLIKELGCEITPKIADSIYTGLTTDTGCFRFSNTDSRAYNAAAELYKLGANCAYINRLMFDTKTRAGILIQKHVLSNMQFIKDDKIVLTAISVKVLEETKAVESDLDCIPSLTRGIEGVHISITMKEKDDGKWKASVRAIAPVDASKICATLGGGGHMGAAGCMLSDNFEESKDMIINACVKGLEDAGV